MAKKEKVKDTDNLYTESEMTPYQNRKNMPGDNKHDESEMTPYQNRKNMPGDNKRGGIIKAKKMANGGSASSRADGIATKGKTRGKMC